MAESRRAPKHAVKEVDEEAQTRRDRRFIIMFVIGGILIVIGMILLSRFLSGS